VVPADRRPFAARRAPRVLERAARGARGRRPFFGEIQRVYDEIGEGVPEGTEFSTPETLADSRAEIEASGLFSDTVWIPGAAVKSLRLGLWRLQWCPVEQRVTLSRPKIGSAS